MGIVGMLVIANWSFGLVRDTGAILLDMTPDRDIAAKIRAEIEGDGDRLNDLHLWRPGPGRLGRFSALSHVTIEIQGWAKMTDHRDIRSSPKANDAVTRSRL